MTDEPFNYHILVGDPSTYPPHCTIKVYEDGKLSVRFDVEQRHVYFAALSDETWGPGEWLVCLICQPDASGFPVYHHRDFHVR